MLILSGITELARWSTSSTYQDKIDSNTSSLNIFKRSARNVNTQRLYLKDWSVRIDLKITLTTKPADVGLTA